MTTQRLNYLRTELENECISYGELIEIEGEAERLGIDTYEMMASDLLNEIEAVIN